MDRGQDGHGKRSDLPDQLVLPETESQVLLLAQLKDPKDQMRAWQKVLKAAPRERTMCPRVTAATVEKVVSEMIGEPRGGRLGRVAGDAVGETESNGHSELPGEATPIPMSARDGMQFNRELEALDAHCGRSVTIGRNPSAGNASPRRCERRPTRQWRICGEGGPADVRCHKAQGDAGFMGIE